MTLHRSVDEELTRRRNDGQVHYNYRHEGEGGILLTGPVAGIVQLNDGTVYDVTPEVIEHAPGHAEALLFHIDEMHKAAGRLPADHVSRFQDNTSR